MCREDGWIPAFAGMTWWFCGDDVMVLGNGVMDVRDE